MTADLLALALATALTYLVASLIAPPAVKGSTAVAAALIAAGWLGWIVIGLLAGAIAKVLTPGPGPGGCLVTIVLGIAGAVLAGYLGQSIGWYGRGEGAGFLAAIVGAVLLLLLYRLVARR